MVELIGEVNDQSKEGFLGGRRCLQLAPGGRFMLAPLYDILSTQPMFDAGQLNEKQMELPMAVGKNRYYAAHSILSCHYLQTAALCGFPEKTVLAIFEELIANSKKNAVDAAVAHCWRSAFLTQWTTSSQSTYCAEDKPMMWATNAPRN